MSAVWTPHLIAPVLAWRVLYGLDLVIPVVMILTVLHMKASPLRYSRGMARIRDIAVYIVAIHFAAIPIAQWLQLWELRLSVALSIIVVYMALNYAIWRGRHDD